MPPVSANFQLVGNEHGIDAWGHRENVTGGFKGSEIEESAAGVQAEVNAGFVVGKVELDQGIQPAEKLPVKVNVSIKDVGGVPSRMG
jgi:hypothetical protein